MIGERDHWQPLSEFDNGGEPYPEDLLGLVRFGPGGLEVPRRCAECARPTYYEEADDGEYHHADDPATGCFLVPAEPHREDDLTHPLVDREVAHAQVCDLEPGHPASFCPDGLEPLPPAPVNGVVSRAPTGRLYLACNHPNRTRPGRCRLGVASPGQTCSSHTDGQEA